MKVVVFAHIPPPHHGQSQMVQLMVDGFRKNPSLGIEVIHVDARLSEDMADVGTARGGKIRLLIRHCRTALKLGATHHCSTLYYIPSPPRRTPLYRDFIALALLRFQFKRIIFHWHSVGLGAWLGSTSHFWERWIARWLLGGVDLSIVLAESNRLDAAKLAPRRIAVVSNGIPDPCPDYFTDLAEIRRQLDQRDLVRVLFLAHCTREKGIFDAIDAVVLANRKSLNRRFVLRVAGGFLSKEEKKEFLKRLAEPAVAAVVKYVGFAVGPVKDRLFRDSDVFLFPTYFANEGQPVNLIEALAYGLPCVTTRWRAIPEYFPDNYPGLCKPQDIVSIASALGRTAGVGSSELMRDTYERKFTIKAHLHALAKAFQLV